MYGLFQLQDIVHSIKTLAMTLVIITLQNIERAYNRCDTQLNHSLTQQEISFCRLDCATTTRQRTVIVLMLDLRKRFQ